MAIEKMTITSLGNYWNPPQSSIQKRKLSKAQRTELCRLAGINEDYENQNFFYIPFDLQRILLEIVNRQAVKLKTAEQMQQDELWNNIDEIESYKPIPIIKKEKGPDNRLSALPGFIPGQSI